MSAIPFERLTGRTVASTMKYVGLQVEKTGPSAAPTSTSPQALCFMKPADIALLEFIFHFAVNGSESHNFGKTITRPTTMISTPENVVQNHAGTLMKAVDTFNIRVKRKTEMPREIVTVSAR